MICPACRHSLPARFPLATSRSRLKCGACRAMLRLTHDSAVSLRYAIVMPSAKAGGALAFAGTWYGLVTGRWGPLLIALVVAIIVSFAISW